MDSLPLVQTLRYQVGVNARLDILELAYSRERFIVLRYSGSRWRRIVGRGEKGERDSLPDSDGTSGNKLFHERVCLAYISWVSIIVISFYPFSPLMDASLFRYALSQHVYPGPLSDFQSRETQTHSAYVWASVLELFKTLKVRLEPTVDLY